MINSISKCFFSGKIELSSFFSVLSAEELGLLYNDSSSKKIKKGNPIFKEGDIPSGLIYLKSGNAKVYKIGAGKREQIVRLARKSSFVGYKALFAGTTHTSNSSAIDDSEIIIFHKNGLFRVIENNPKFSMSIIKALANEISFNFNRVINLTQKHIRGRIAESLILLKEIYGKMSDGQTLNVKFTRENIAHFSNMTTSNAIRTLRAFEKEGLIITENKYIKLLNEEEIIKISNQG
jgi:CRP-like cAMP-binding protein